MARGNWRNWEGRDGAESYRGQKVPTRPAHCEWCGYEWNTRIPKNAVCPKCRCEESFAKELLKHPEWEKNISRKCLVMKGRFK